ncbi:MAG: hypothetical protein ACP5JT_06140, partial [Thermoplasmata archaeon]
MKMCEYANNMVDMLYMIKLIKEEKIYIWHGTTGTEYSFLLYFDRTDHPIHDDKFSLPFYYQDWHRNFYLVINYYRNNFYIYRNIPDPLIKLI